MQRRRRRVPLAIVAIVAGFGAAAVTTAPGVRSAGATPTPTAPLATSSPLVSGTSVLFSGTSVLSPRRLPEWLATTVASQRLRATLSSILGQPALAGTAVRSCLVVTQNGRAVVAVNPSLAVQPASNMKLLTATVVLDKIGPDAQYTTTVAATGPVLDGVEEGNLVLVGGGDPLLRTPGYQAGLPYGAGVYTNVVQLADQVRAAGITRVTGSVIGDDGRYDAQRSIPSWPARYAEQDDVGPLSALEIDDGFLAGDPGVAPGATPPAAAAQYFATLLGAAGVQVDGGGAAGLLPPGARAVTSIHSAAMQAVLGEILRESDDTGAELLVKELGYRFGGAGSTAAGVAVMRADLAAEGLPLQGLSIVDGSGLDAADRVTCQLEDALLARAGPSGLLSAELPVAGQSGTLRDRLLHSAATGRVLAKTGTLFGVSALSGYVEPEPGARAAAAQGPLAAPLVFSLVINGLAPDGQGEAIGDAAGNQVALALCAFPTTPPLAELAPQGSASP